MALSRNVCCPKLNRIIKLHNMTEVLKESMNTKVCLIFSELWEMFIRDVKFRIIIFDYNYSTFN